MKSFVLRFCCPALLFFLTAAVQGAQPFKEGALLKKDPVPHSKDIEYHANPRFAPPPVEMTEKAFLKDPLVDFSADPSWKARFYDCEGFLCLSRDQMVRKKPNMKLELTSGKNGALAELLPVKKVVSPREFDTFMLLAYAKNVSVVTVKFRKPDGKIHVWQSRKNNFNELLTGWHLLRIPLYVKMPAGTELVSVGFQSIRFRTYRAPDIWHLEQFGVAMTRDHLKRPPVRFNTGKVVQIPVTPDGARPVSGEKVTHRVWKEGNAFKLSYMNSKGVGAVFTYRPEKGTLADISVSCNSGKEIRPAAGSGPIFTVGVKSFDIRKKGEVKSELLSCKLEKNQVKAVWKFNFGSHSQIITYRFGIAGKSLIADMDSKECFLKEWWPGHAEGTSANAKIFAVPFMNHTPRILWNEGWFFSHFHDYYKGNFSIHSHDAGGQVSPGKAVYNFLQIGYCYTPRTDGSRHPLRETVYITAARNFEEVLITPSNPKSPYKEMLSNNLYKKFEVRSDIFRKAKVLTDLYDQYGVNHIFFDIFGWLWISGLWGSGESAFHSAQPSYIHQKQGGDKAFVAMLEDLQQKKIVPGYYETYNAMQIKSGVWDPDKVVLRPDGTWNTAHAQAYMHKMWALAEWEQGYFRKRHQKYQPRRTGYVDGFTSRLPFMYNDYDHRYPEAGKMIDTIRAIGTGFQRIRENYRGPVFAEGRGADYYWVGLNDGDYGKLPNFGHRIKPRKARYELLVDFRLKKLNPLAPAWGLNIGYAMFCGNPWYMTDDYSLLYHYMAMNIAFGTVGFIEPCGEAYPNPHKHFDKTLETYYLVRQLQKRYMMEEVKRICYFDGRKLVPTEEALVSGKYRDNMVYIEYKNGLEIYVNCNWDERIWEISVDGKKYTLPAGGWFARQGKTFLEYSVLQNGSRVSFVDSPEYTYLNGYGKKVKAGNLTTDRILIRYKTGRKAGRDLIYPPLKKK